MGSRAARRIGVGLGAAVLLLLAGEAVARYGLGLGDPPLTMRDDRIEYLFVPGCYHRFGNRICYNALSMRSDVERPDILVIGDSVVNGGSLTDQDALATEIVAKRTGLGVGNVSAGSWGPANQLAYLKVKGWPPARAAILVMSTGDLDDLPRFEAELGPDMPEEKPVSALWEAVTRYLPRYLPGLRQTRKPGPEPTEPTEPSAGGLAAVRALLSALKEHYPAVAVIHHPDRAELRAGAYRSDALRRIADELGIPLIPAMPALDPADYRDGIHLNDSGQAAYADLLLDLLVSQGISGPEK